MPDQWYRPPPSNCSQLAVMDTWQRFRSMGGSNGRLIYGTIQPAGKAKAAKTSNGY